MMGMPITIEIVDAKATGDIFNEVFTYFAHIDEKFSTYKSTSEIEAINRGTLALADASEEMRLIFAMCEETKRETNGYFDIKTPAGNLDPSGEALPFRRRAGKARAIYHLPAGTI